jgi:hypothetical protein
MTDWNDILDTAVRYSKGTGAVIATNAPCDWAQARRRTAPLGSPRSAPACARPTAALIEMRLRHPGEAAGHFANAAAVLPQTDEYLDTRFGYSRQEADALYQQRDELGDNAALLLAIQRRQSLLERKPRERRRGLGARPVDRSRLGDSATA